MGNNYILEAFKEFDLLEDTENEFPLDPAGMEDLSSFLDYAGEDDDNYVDVIDLEAEAEEELKQSYVGKVILDCNICHSHVFLDKDEIQIDDEGNVNIETECPYCMSTEGFNIIGEVKPYEDEAEEEEELIEEEPVDKEPVEESFKEALSRVRRGDSRHKKALKQKLDTEDFRESFKRRPSKSLTEKTSRKLKGSLKDFEIPGYEAEIIYYKEVNADGVEEYEVEYSKDGVKFCKVVFTPDGKRPRVMVHEYPYKSLKFYNTFREFALKIDSIAEECFWQIEHFDESLKPSKARQRPSKARKLSESDYPVANARKSGTDTEVVKTEVKTKNGNKVEYGYSADGTCVYSKLLTYKGKPVDYWKNHNMNEGWRGSDEIEMVSHGSTGDPDLVYNGYTFNYWDIEDALWQMFLEDNDKWTDADSNDPQCEAEFNEFVKANAPNYLEDCIFGGYFADGSKSWHDQFGEALDPKDNPNFKKGSAKPYWYFTKHGVQPGSVPKGVNIEEIKDTEHGTYFSTYDLLTTKELKDFDIKEKKPALGESVIDVDTANGSTNIETAEELITVEENEDGGISINTRPLDVPEEEYEAPDEVIAPLDLEGEAEIIDDAEATGFDDFDEEPFDDEEFPADDFDEESFDELGESYLKKCYENVTSFRTTSVEFKDNALIVEGAISFDSGNKKKTAFRFNLKESKNGKVYFTGLNEQISKGSKSFNLRCKLVDRKLCCEALRYNYKAQNELNESVKVYGTVRRKLTEANKDLSSVKGSTTKALSDNIAKVNSAKTKDEVLSAVTEIFADNNVTAPGAQKIINNIKKSRNLVAALTVVYNSIQAGSGDAVI